MIHNKKNPPPAGSPTWPAFLLEGRFYTLHTRCKNILYLYTRDFFCLSHYIKNIFSWCVYFFDHVLIIRLCVGVDYCVCSSECDHLEDFWTLDWSNACTFIYLSKINYKKIINCFDFKYTIHIQKNHLRQGGCGPALLREGRSYVDICENFITLYSSSERRDIFHI